MATLDEEITEKEFDNFKCECSEDIEIPDGVIETLDYTRAVRFSIHCPSDHFHEGLNK